MHRTSREIPTDVTEHRLVFMPANAGAWCVFGDKRFFEVRPGMACERGRLFPQVQQLLGNGGYLDQPLHAIIKAKAEREDPPVATKPTGNSKAASGSVFIYATRATSSAGEISSVRYRNPSGSPWRSSRRFSWTAPAMSRYFFAEPGSAISVCILASRSAGITWAMAASLYSSSR